MLSLHGGGAAVRLTVDGHLCIHSTARYHDAVLLSQEQLRQEQDLHRSGFTARFPRLKEVPFEYTGSGIEGNSRNSTNIFSHITDNVYFAEGYNGSGPSRGTALGTTIGDYACGSQSQLIDDFLASPPPACIPPQPFLDIGASLTVRFGFRGVGPDR